MDTTDSKGVVFEDMDVGSFGLALRLVDEFGEAVVIKLMVSEHVNDRNLQILSDDPFKPLVLNVNIASKDDYIRTDIWDIEITEFNV